jgi:hypothetical protein
MPVDPIKCPKCGKKELTISGVFRINYLWLQEEDDEHAPLFFDYEFGDYEPIDSGYPEFICHSCRHVWQGEKNINDYLDD